MLRRDFLKAVGAGAAVGGVVVAPRIDAAPPVMPPSGRRLFVSLHHSHPGENQARGEVRYKGYRRMPVTFDEHGQSGDVHFPECTGGRAVVRYYALGVSEQGSGRILACEPIEYPLAVSSGITAAFLDGLQLEAT